VIPMAAAGSKPAYLNVECAHSRQKITVTQIRAMPNKHRQHNAGR
jgi:hypothetical protein